MCAGLGWLQERSRGGAGGLGSHDHDQHHHNHDHHHHHFQVSEVQGQKAAEEMESRYSTSYVVVNLVIA